MSQDFLQFLISHKDEVINLTLQHIGLTMTSLLIALIIGLPLGMVITRYKKLAGIILGSVGIIQTIPSLALLGFLLPFFGIGAVPAIIALFLYALLPIVRNTYTGIKEVDSSIKEAARGMGMSNFQILTKVEIPLAMPVVFSGIRTACVINVGVATLCALIASGGLGEFIYRGIALNNTNMILAGAIPAAFLAIFFDFTLGLIQKLFKQTPKLCLKSPLLLLFIAVMFVIIQSFTFNSTHSLIAGFVPEFIERTDGYPGLKRCYGLNLKIKELDSQLMFQALKAKQVDIICGYSTEGRIKTYNFKILEDDKHFFPPYYACPVINGGTLKQYPFIKDIFSKLAGKITNEQITELNYKVEYKRQPINKVAKDFLKELGLRVDIEHHGIPDIIIGSKNFTEQFILAEIFAVLIENYSDLNVEVKKGLAGTKICFDALTKNEINIYPEYTGTALFAILKPQRKVADSILRDKDRLYSYVKSESKKSFNVEWLQPLGFNNTWALMMRDNEANKLMIKTISDLRRMINENKL